MKRAFMTAIAVACLTVSAHAAPTCGVPLPEVERVATAPDGPQRLKDVVAMAFLDQFNNTGPITNYQAPVWVIDRPQDNVIEVIAMSDGQACVFVAPGHFRDVFLKMLYGDNS